MRSYTRLLSRTTYLRLEIRRGQSWRSAFRHAKALREHAKELRAHAAACEHNALVARMSIPEHKAELQHVLAVRAICRYMRVRNVALAEKLLKLEGTHER